MSCIYIYYIKKLLYNLGTSSCEKPFIIVILFLCSKFSTFFTPFHISKADILYNYIYMTSTGDLGRLGNQIIRNLAVSLLAEKHNLKVNYYNNDLIYKLGIKLFSGINSYESIQDLTDDNYFTIYNCDNLNYNLQPNHNYFQTKEITNFLYNYLHSDKVKSNIIENNPFRNRYNNNNILFIHIR